MARQHPERDILDPDGTEHYAMRFFTEALRSVDIDKLGDIISELKNSEFDFVILDVPAGLSSSVYCP